MKFINLATFSLALTVFGCSTLRVSTDYVHNVDFRAYKTFSIKFEGPLRKLPDSGDIEDSLGNALLARGLTRLPSGGDLLVVPHFHLEKEMKAQMTNYGFGGSARMGSTTRGNQVGGLRPGQSVFVEVPVGTIVVTMVDLKADTIIWRGIAKDQFSVPMAQGDWKLMADRVFPKLVEDFPPKR